MALKTFYAYISPEPDHLPLIAAAGMLLLEPNHVTQFNLQDHFSRLKALSHLYVASCPTGSAQPSLAFSPSEPPS